nr:hypothetical protein [Tanacetum cinerariifolium]
MTIHAEIEEKKWCWCCCCRCCCGGGAVVVVLLWWCCGAAVVVFGVVLRWLLFVSGVVVVNIGNYEVTDIHKKTKTKPKQTKPSTGMKRAWKTEAEGKLRIEQYIQVQDYALWVVIENGNSFKPVPRIIANADGTSTSTISGPVTTKEKEQKKNDVKARSMLLMALPNEHLLTFSQYKLQKIVSQLAILGENISKKDLNMKFLRSLPAEWNTHVVFWRNKPDIETMSFDDLYNNFKIVEQEVKRTTVSSSSSGSPNMDFLSSPSSVNEVDTDNIQVSAASTPVSTVSSPNNTANLSDPTVYAFLANQPNGSQLVHEDLEQIHKDDVEEMDLKCHLIKDYEFHDKKMVLNPVLKTVEKKTSQREVRPVWNHAMRVIIKISPILEGIAPTTVLTKSGIVPISTARQSSSRVAAPVSTARHINTVAPKPIVNVAKSRQNAFQKTHSLSKGPFHRQTALKNRYLVNTAKVKSVNTVYTAKGKSVASAVGKQGSNAVKSLACWVWRPKIKVQDHVSKNSGSYICKRFDYVDPKGRLNGCSRNMTGNQSFLPDYQEYDGGFVAFAGSSKGGKITGKGKIRTGKLDFEDVYFVKELKFNLFSVSQMCDKKNNVVFTKTECLILSPDFKLPDENQVLLKAPRKNNVYSFDLKNVVLSKGLTCLFEKATNDESNLWHRRLGHINFKTMNKLVKGNLVRGLPSKIFKNDHTCVACQKGKQHKASLITDDYSRFSLVFFLAKKDETYGNLKDVITGIENQLNHKVKIIRCDNGTEFKNYEMNQFCRIKGIKREFSNARTPQQNRVAERKNRTLIEAVRTMLADSLLPIPFWAEAVNTACYVQNRLLFFNTLDHLGKFDGKADEGFLVKSGPEWLFDIVSLTNSMNYHLASTGNRTNGIAGSKIHSDVGQEGKEKVFDQEYILLPVLNTSSEVSSSNEEVESSPKDDVGKKSIVEPTCVEGGKIDDLGSLDQ